MKSWMEAHGSLLHTHVACILSPFASLWTLSAVVCIPRAILSYDSGKCARRDRGISSWRFDSANRNTCTEYRNEKMISSYGAPSCPNGLTATWWLHESAKRFAFYFFCFPLPRRTSAFPSIDVFIALLLRIARSTRAWDREKDFAKLFVKPWRRGDIYLNSFKLSRRKERILR